MKSIFTYALIASLSFPVVGTTTALVITFGTASAANAGLNCSNLRGARLKRCRLAKMESYRRNSAAASTYLRDTRRVGKGLEYTTRLSCRYVVKRIAGRLVSRQVCRHTPRLK